MRRISALAPLFGCRAIGVAVWQWTSSVGVIVDFRRVKMGGPGVIVSTGRVLCLYQQKLFYWGCMVSQGVGTTKLDYEKE